MKNVLLILALFCLPAVYAQNPTRPAGCLDSLQIMEAFTPNGDSNNDGFYIYFACVPDEMEITIFNRWGLAIFDSKQSNFFWDGKDDKGVEMPTGVYFYTLKYTYLGEEKTITGNVSLIR